LERGCFEQEPAMSTWADDPKCVCILSELARYKEIICVYATFAELYVKLR